MRTHSLSASQFALSLQCPGAMAEARASRPTCFQAISIKHVAFNLFE